MTTIAVLSDTHRNYGAIEAIVPILDECDMIVHLGDHYDDMDPFYSRYRSKLYRVHGNCDYGQTKEIILPVEQILIFATHGDLYGVKRGTERLKRKAREEGCAVALYGHTHAAEIDEEEGFITINPGAMTAFSPEKTFCYLVVHGKKCTAVLRTVTC